MHGIHNSKAVTISVSLMHAHRKFYLIYMSSRGAEHRRQEYCTDFFLNQELVAPDGTAWSLLILKEDYILKKRYICTYHEKVYIRSPCKHYF